MTLDTLLKLAHVLAVILWLGGMVFAHFFLRPSLEAAAMEPPQRLRLMREVLRRFFAAVSAAVAVVLVSGAWMVERSVAMVRASGGVFTMPLGWVVMTVLGVAMALIFFFIRLRGFRALEQALDHGETASAAAALAGIRRWVGVNMVLGLAVVVAAIVGVR